ncbi:MAG: N-6 DNA methylase [Burkholderiales bacterium]|jgi:adenine-specific DNA-methyltransferase|nr:N-6 DNA methylase [Burkholderiales bacterium]
MNVLDKIEANYSKQTPFWHRKKFAQFFTPYSIAELMAEWLLGNENLKTVLEPAFGLGVFSRVLLSKRGDLQIKGYEIDSLMFEYVKKELSLTKKINLLLEDYMYNDWQNKYDGIVCNPPYFKFHDYDNKKILGEIEKKLKCKLKGFTNLYTLFLLKSIHQLNPNGRCAYIIPSEFLNSDYGKLIKAHLLETGSLRHIIVFDFEENVFDDALTTASIIFCAKDNRANKVQFTNVRSVNELNTIKELVSNYPQSANNSRGHFFSELDPEIKWKNYYQLQSKNKFNNLVPFSTYAKVVRGIATGANDYFIFSLSKAKKYDINECYLLPCICRSADVQGSFFTESDLEDLKNRDKDVFLINALNVNNKSVIDYLRKGEDEQIHKKHLTASRNPWYSLEKRPPAPIWVSVFNRTGLRFVRNETKALNLTTFHCIYPRSNLFSGVSVDLLFAYLLTDTARQIFEGNSREYGNGLQKFEPNDLNEGMMLDLSRVPISKRRKIEKLYRENIYFDERGFVGEIDRLFTENFS